MKKFIIPFLAILFLSISVNAQKVKDKVKNKNGVVKEKHVGTVTPVKPTPVVTPVKTTVHKPVVHHTTVHHTAVHHTTVHHTTAHKPVVHKTVAKPVPVTPTPVVTPVPSTGKTKTKVKPNKTIIEENGVKTKEIHKHDKTKTKTKDKN
jgi:hypothetical protein